MKRILLFTTALLMGIIVHAQCTQDASTNPANPVNNDLTPIMQTGQNAVNEFKNTFDWGAHSNTSFHDIPLNLNANWSLGSHAGAMISPFSTSMPGGYSYLNQNGALPENCDWHWEDGWELMWTHLGTYPNGEGVKTTNANRIITVANGLANPNTPYFFLYNRYTGKLRLFGNMFGANNDHLQLFLRHDKPRFQAPVSGVFRHVSGYDRPLDQPTLNTFISSNNKNPGNNNAWFSTDFQLGFDPCVCDYPTQWKMQYQLITNWDVNLYGREVSQELPVNKFEDEYLSNTSIDKTSESGGTLLYKTFGGLYDDYMEEMEAYEQKMAKYSSLESQIKRELLTMSKTLITNGVTGALLPSSGVKKQVSKFMKPINKNFDPKNAEDMAKGIRKASNGILGAGLDHLTKQVISSDILTEPSRPSMPTATFAESKITGTIARSNSIAITGLYNPGSFKAGVNQITPYNYPLWNKPVGLFALLRTPHLKLYHNDNVSGVWGNFFDYEQRYGEWQSTVFDNPLLNFRFANTFKICEYKYEQDLNFKIGEKLFYKYNDNLDFDKDLSNNRYSIQIILESEAGDELYFDEPNFGKFQTLDVSNTNLTIDKHLVKTATNNEQVTLATDWLNMEDVLEHNFGGRIRNAAKFVVQSGIAKQQGPPTYSVFRDFQVTHNHLFEMSNGQMELNPSLVDDLKYKIKKVILKVMPDMYFNQVASNGGKINTTQVFSYLLFDEEKGIDLIASHGEWLTDVNRKAKAQQYLPYKLVLDNETVSTTSAYVNSVVGAEIRVNAQAIEVKNGLTVQAGYSLALNALDDITVSNTSVRPVVSFNIRDDFYGLGKITEATQSEVDAFCSGINKEYRANQDASTPAQTKDEDSIRHETFAQKITVFPNPSSGVVQFEFLKPFGEGQFHLMDVNGRLIRTKKLTLELSQSHDLSYVSDGIYLLKITTDGETHAQKLMLHKH